MDLMRLDLSHAKTAVETWKRAFPSAGNGRSIQSAGNGLLVPHMYEVLLRLNIRIGEVYATSPDFEGVAAWLPPGRVYPSVIQVIMSAPIDLLICFLNGGLDLASELNFQASMQRRNAPKDHWHLGPIGVDPNYQGQGLASRLIRPMLERTDAEGMPIYLDANSEEAVAIYEHFGFQVKERMKMPGSDFWNASMLRLPQYV